MLSQAVYPGQHASAEVVPLEYLNKEIHVEHDTKKALASSETFLVYTLTEAIATAINKSLDLEIESRRIRLAELQLQQSYRNFFPRVRLRYQEERGKISDDPYKGNSWSAEGRQPLFAGGELVFAKKQAQETLAAAVAAAKKKEDEVVFNTIKTFFEWLAYQKIEETLHDHEKTVAAFADKQYQGWDQGLVAEVDVKGVQYYVNQFEQMIWEIRKEREEAAYDFKQAINQEARDDIDIVFHWPVSPWPLAQQDEPLPLPSLENFLQEAFESRAELLEFQHKYNASSYAVKVEKAEGLPRVDVVGRKGQAGEGFTNNNSFDRSEEWAIGVEISWNFGGNTLKYNYNKAKAAPQINSFESTNVEQQGVEVNILDGMDMFSDIEEATITNLEQKRELEELVKSIYKEVTTTYYELYRAWTQLQYARKGMDFERQNYHILEYRFTQNDVRSPEVMEQHIKWIESIKHYQESIAQVYISIAQMNAVVGKSSYLDLNVVYNNEGMIHEENE